MVKFLMLTLALAALSGCQTAEVQANPIRKVASMLQGLQKKVEAEAKKDQEIYDKFMC